MTTDARMKQVSPICHLFTKWPEAELGSPERKLSALKDYQELSATRLEPQCGKGFSTDGFEKIGNIVFKIPVIPLTNDESSIIVFTVFLSVISSR